MSDYLKRQNELRLNAWEEAKHLLDAAAAESRDLTAEESVIYDRISEDMDKRAQVIEQITKDEERALRLDVAAASVRTDEAAPADDDDAEAIRSLARGEVRSLEFEKRDVQDEHRGASPNFVLSRTDSQGSSCWSDALDFDGHHDCRRREPPDSSRQHLLGIDNCC